MCFLRRTFNAYAADTSASYKISAFVYSFASYQNLSTELAYRAEIVTLRATLYLDQDNNTNLLLFEYIQRHFTECKRVIAVADTSRKGLIIIESTTKFVD